MRYLLLLPLFVIATFADNAEEMVKQFKTNNNIDSIRNAYIDELNNIEPGLDYNIINQEIRYEKARYKNNQKLNRIQDEDNNVNVIGSWFEKGSNNQAGRVIAADIDFPNGLIYCASHGGVVWRGDMNGENWTSLNDSWQFPGIRKVKVYTVNDRKRIVVIGSNQSYWTEDEGQTWNTGTGLENVQRWGGITEASLNDNGIVYAIGQEWDYGEDWRSKRFLYYSDDYGESFERIRVSLVGNRLRNGWMESNSDRYFLAEKDTIFEYKKGELVNQSFINNPEINSFYANDYSNRLSLNGVNNNGNIALHYAVRVVTQGLDGTVYYKSNSEDFSVMNYTGDFDKFDYWSYNISNSDIDKIYWGNVNLEFSYDGGKSWELVNKWGEYYGDPENKLHADIPSIDVFDDPTNGDEVILISTDGGLYISRSDMKEVKNLSLYGHNISQYYDVATSADGSVVYAGSQDQGFQRSLDDNNTVLSYDQLISGDYGQFATSDGGQTLWSVYPTFAMVYQNANTQNENRNSWSYEGSGWKFMAPTAPDYSDPNSIYISGGSAEGVSSLWKLTIINREIIPEQILVDFDVSGTWFSAVSTTPTNKSIIYTMTADGRFAKSTNSGSSWVITNNFESPGPHYFHGAEIRVSEINPERIIICGAGYSNPGVYQSFDGGETFEALADGLPSTMIYDVEFGKNDEVIYAATAVGPYMYYDGNWIDIQSGVPDQAYWAVEYVPAKDIARFASYGRGIWDFKIETLDATNVQTFESIDFSVSPNPASNSIKVNYEYTYPLSIKIYDNSGKIVKQIETNTNSEIDVSNLPTGIYMIIATGNGNTGFEKLIVK
jgi:hypothetical protein